MDNNIISTKPPKSITYEKYVNPKQSADALFNFMPNFNYLVEKLAAKAIIPRYNVENIDYLNINIPQIAYPMICFCDINIQKLKYHIKNYGSFGIAFYKKWGMSNGIQPIQYINRKSCLYKDYGTAFKSSIDMGEQNDDNINNVRNYISTHLFYIKPINGYIKGKRRLQNLHDEKEWRFVPSLNNKYTELPQILSEQSIINTTALKTLNDAIRIYEKSWLKFEYDYIKYLIVDNNLNKKKLIENIIKIDCLDLLKYDLVSKIIVFDEIRKDW